jgi:outer membrane protein TolC
MRSSRPHRVLVVPLLALALPATAPIALPAAAAAQEESAARPYEAPLFQYGEGRISLLESVRLTLNHDPQIMLKGADARLRSGIAQELRGAFDWVLKGEVSYDYREQELLDSAKKAELDKRKKADLNIVETCEERDRQAQVLEELRNELASVGDGVTLAPTDLAVDRQLEFFDILIRNAENDAQRGELTAFKLDFITTEISAREIVLLNLQRGCDQAVVDRRLMGDAPDTEYFEQALLDVRLQKKFRSGVVLTPFLTGQFDKNQFKGKKNGPEEDIIITERDPVTGEPRDVVLQSELGPVRRTIDLGGKGVKDVYQASVGFEVNIPMLRGRGFDAVAFREQAALRDFAAAEYAVTHSASESVAKTANAYWTLFAAQQRVTVLERSVSLEQRLVEMTDALIEADEMPRAERSRALAAEANARSQLEAAQRDLVRARMELALAMGVGVESEANAPLAEGPFPGVPADAALDALDESALALGAVDNRFDRRAARTAVEAREIETRGALLDQKSKLDVGVTVSSRAQGEDSLSNATDEWANPSWKLKLQGEHPFGNRERRGRYEQALARLDQQNIQAGDLERQIKLNVVQTLRSLEEATDRYREAARAAQLSQETVDAEFEKLRLGSSTLLDAIQTEQQLTQAQLSVVAAQQEVAALLSRLRFETGTMVQATEGGYQVDEPALISLPEPASAPSGGAL